MTLRVALAGTILAMLATTSAPRIQAKAQPRPARPQKNDEEYTKFIRENLQDPRITTELVDHLPASDTVPTPLKFLGRAVGMPGELTYAKDIERYYEALGKSSRRAKFWKIGASEEGRDIIALAIADEATIASLEKYQKTLDALTDPRQTTDARAKQLIATGKPVYYVTSGMHSTETGGPEMLIELASRLIVEDSPFIQQIRSNVINLITPVLEVDGREKEVDTYYFNKKRAVGDARLPLVYWGKYVAHDDNRDGMGQLLKLTQAVTALTLVWHLTILHDLHEAQTYLYASTGTGPCNDSHRASGVFQSGAGVERRRARGAPGGAPNGGLGQSITPNAVPLRISSFDPDQGDMGSQEARDGQRPRSDEVARVQEATAPAGGGDGRGGAAPRPRVVLQFPADPSQMLLSGTLANGQGLSNRAAVVDAKLGQGHVVSFAIRPFWRWQTQGTYTLGFNVIMNWNDLDAGGVR